MATFANYDPILTVLVFRGAPVLGFMDGTFVSVERSQDSFEKHVGSLGDVVRRRIRDRSGTVTLTLQQSSPSNDILSASYLLDELSGLGFGPLLLQDLNGSTLISSPVAWVRKPAVVELADSVTGREWMIDCHELEVFVGGATQLGI